MKRARHRFSTTGFCLAALLSAALGAGCSSMPAADSEALASTEAAVQSAYLVAGGSQFDLAQDGTQAAKATGVLKVPILDVNGMPEVVTSATGPIPVRGTCGVTFISPHYAITAAHCVSGSLVPDPAHQQFTVQTFNIDAANRASLISTADIGDSYFPYYSPAGARYASQVPGYSAASFTCSLEARCGFGPSFQCGIGADIAMLRCSERANDAPWIPVAVHDDLSGPVEMYWFHELLKMPTTQPPSGAPAADIDHYNHYTVFGNHEDNFHYLESPTNAILPLKSVPWGDSTPRRRVGVNGDGTVQTDLFGCHGTSGSGVLQKTASGGFELLGPVSTGTFGGLCGAPSFKGAYNISYTSTNFTQQLATQYAYALGVDRGCAPGATRSCANCGTQTCGANFTWGTCTGSCAAPHCSDANGGPCSRKGPAGACTTDTGEDGVCYCNGYWLSCG